MLKGYTVDELFDAYRNAYKGLDDIKVDVKSPNGDYTLGIDVTPYEAVDLIQKWLKDKNYIKKKDERYVKKIK